MKTPAAPLPRAPGPLGKIRVNTNALIPGIFLVLGKCDPALR